MSTDDKKEADDLMDNNTTVESPVLNISGRRAPRQRHKAKRSSSAERAVPSFQKFEVPAVLSKLLLKSNVPLNPVQLENKYLGVLCLKNTKTNVRMYHMFYTSETNIGKDYKATGLLYEDQPDIKEFNNVTVYAFCPESLHRSAVKYFSEYKWSKDGNVLITPISETNEWIISSKLHNLREAQDLKLINYIKFLKLSKS